MELDDFRLQVLDQGSSITFIGIPHGLLGKFQIDLIGNHFLVSQINLLLDCNVRLLGDQITEDPIVVQSTWTVAHD